MTRPNTCKYEHSIRPTTHKTEDCLFTKLAAIIDAGPRRSPERCASYRFGSIATVSTATVGSNAEVGTKSRYECPVNTTVGTKSADTGAVATNTDDKSGSTRQYHLSKVTLAPQCSYVAVARHPKHRSQYLDSRGCEAKYSPLFWQLFSVLSISCYRCFILPNPISLNHGTNTCYLGR